MAPAKKAAAAMPDAPKKPITTTTTNTTSKTSPLTTKPTRTPARTATHNLSILLNTTLLATLLTAPVTFPNATRAALHAAHADIAAWQHSVAAVRSDPVAVARAQFDNLLTWVGDITSPGLSAQQRQWAQEESDDAYNNKKLMVAPTVALDKQAGSIYTKAKTGDKEWRRERDGSEAAKPKGTKESASASGESQPVGDIIADILASFQKNKDGKAPAAAAGQKAKKSAGSDGSSLTKEQQNIADTVGALVGLFGKAIADNTKPAAADTVKPKLEKKLEATSDKKSTPAGIAKREESEADTEQVPVAAAAAEVFTEEIKVDTTDAETVVVVEETHQVEIKQAKPVARAAGSNPAEAFSDLLGLLGKLSSPGGIPKKSASSSSSTSSSSSSSRSATKGGDSAADLIGLLGTLGSALGNGNSKQGAAAAGGGGATDLLGLLGSAMGSANGKKGGAGGGAADLIGLLGALAGNAGSAGSTTSGRTGATGGNTGPANPLAGLDIGTTVKMMKMMSAFQGISKTVSGDQASGSREGVDGARAGSGGGGGAGDMADMLSAGMDAFNFLGKVMANMPTPGEREARRRGNTIGDEV